MGLIKRISLLVKKLTTFKSDGVTESDKAREVNVLTTPAGKTPWLV